MGSISPIYILTSLCQGSILLGNHLLLKEQVTEVVSLSKVVKKKVWKYAHSH